MVGPEAEADGSYAEAEKNEFGDHLRSFVLVFCIYDAANRLKQRLKVN